MAGFRFFTQPPRLQTAPRRVLAKPSSMRRRSSARKPRPCSVAAPRSGSTFSATTIPDNYGEYQDPSALDDLLASLSSAGLKWISVRVIWSVVEPDAMGQYDDIITRNIGRIIDRASSHDIDVMLDFHTLFGVAGHQNWTYPQWAYAGPAGDQKGSIQIARDPRTRRAFASMQAHVVEQLKGWPALKVISVVNEPWGRPDDIPDLNAMIGDLAAHTRLIARQKVAIRLAAGWSFTSRRADQRFDPSLATAFDVIGMNVYLDPNSETQDSGGASWTEVDNAAALVHGQQHLLWITEFGDDTSNDDQQAAYFTAAVKRMSPTADVMLGWMWQSSKTEDTFNIAASWDRGRPSFHCLTHPDCLRARPRQL